MERVRFIFLALAALLTSTQNLRGKEQPVHESFAFTGFSLFEENGKVGLKDDAGRVLIPALYEAIGWSNGKLSILDQVVGYQIDGRWGLITTSNKIVTEAEFLKLTPGEGSYLVAQKNSPLSQRPSFGIITTSGKMVIPFIYDALYLVNMRAIVMSKIGTRYLFGLTDLSHRIVIPIQYQRISSLGSLRFAVENFDDKTAIFSEEGDRITQFDIDSISPFRKDYAIVYQDRKQGLINRSGHIIVKPTYGEVKVTDDGEVMVRELHQLFLLRGDNTMIKQFNADGISPLSRENYAVHAAGKVQVTDNNFKPLHSDYFSSVSEFQNGLAVYRKDSQAGVISSDGRIIIPAEHHALEIEHSGTFRVCLGTGGKNRWTILDSAGTPITEKHYEYIAPFNGKYYPVKRRGYWGALNKAGREIITCVHDSLVQELHNNIVVRFKGEYGVMNLEEHWVVTPQPNPLKLLNEEVYLEFNDSTTFLKSFTGDLVYFSENPLEYDRGYVREQLPSGAHWLVNMSGIVIDRSNQPQQVEQIFPESEGLRAIRKDGKYGFIDNAGRLRIANRYELVKPFTDGLAAIRIRDRWGFIDHQEKLVVQPVYDHVGNFDNGLAIVELDGYSGLIDATGRVILPIRYDEIIPNAHKRYVIRTGQVFGMVDSTGAIIIHPKYDEISDPGNGYIIVERHGKSGVLTLRGVSTIPMIYDSLSFDRYHNHFVATKKSKLKDLKKNGE